MQYDVSRSSGLAKTILQGTVNGGRRQGRQEKRWEDNIREWTGLVPKGSGEQRKMEETGCEVICGAQPTPTVKGWVKVVNKVTALGKKSHASDKIL